VHGDAACKVVAHLQSAGRLSRHATGDDKVLRSMDVRLAAPGEALQVSRSLQRSFALVSSWSRMTLGSRRPRR
jgi:hypothetical protein